MTTEPKTPPFAALFLLDPPSTAGPKAERPHPDAARAGRERLPMDADWRFALGHAYDRARDFNHDTAFFSYLAKAGYADGPASPHFNDLAWRSLDLPHDWVVELPFDARGDMNHGYKAVGSEFPENSVAWYRKTFDVPEKDFGRRITVEFDGVFRDARVWCNGFYLGNHPGGYTGFAYDIADYLNYGGANVIVVRVDATMEEGWFYEGGGIYRHVWLLKTAPLHVARHGIFVTTEMDGDAAAVTARSSVANDGDGDAVLAVEQSITDSDGTIVATARIEGVAAAAGEARETSCTLDVANPRLWSLESPHLYKLVTRVIAGGDEVDHCETTFGIRTMRFDAGEGFFLNGRRVTIKGTNNHQDHAGMGTAVPDALNEHRIRRLKSMGCNAYRASHNPPTPELLDACDRLGMLVMDEGRLMGSSPAALDQLREMVLRDRNHPCVFLWSLGNEEWGIEANAKGMRIAKTMQRIVRGLDPTRATTVAASGSWGRGVTAAAEVAGFNYFVHDSTDRFHAELPDRPSIGSEECSKFGTRGVYVNDPEKCRLATDDTNYSDWGASSEQGWKHYAERPWAAGVFVWTGFDYRGEPAPFEWPAIGSQFGILDTCGFAKDHFHYYRAWWQDEPALHIFPHWNWPDRMGEEITVFCYANCDEVELLVNGESLGRRAMERNGHLEWKAKHAPGEIVARGFNGGREAGVARVETTGEPAALELLPDRATIAADGKDVAVVAVRVVDVRGRMVPTAMNEVTFHIDGPGRIIGVGNGDPTCHEPERHFDRIVPFHVEGWRVAEVDGFTDRTEVQPGIDDSQWSNPLDWTWRNRAAESLPAAFVLRGRFDVASVPSGAGVTLFVRVLGERQSIHLNGREVAVESAGEGGHVAIDVDSSFVREGRNIVAILVAPRSQGRAWLGGGFASVRFLVRAEPWKRSAFNGLAQVIVQSTREAGEIELRATSPGLDDAVLGIEGRRVAR